MATTYDNTLMGSEGDDTLVATPGANLIDAGAGNDTIFALDGVNTIEFGVGSGMDTVEYAPPRTYQFADFLAQAQAALQELDSFSGTEYTNQYFATASRLLVNELPPEISAVLAQFRSQGRGEGATLGSVDPSLARAAFESLTAWINTPNTNIIELGAGITPGDLQLQLGDAITSYGLPSQFTVAINGQDAILFDLARTDYIAGSTATPPSLDISFRFADGTVLTAAQLFAAGSAPVNNAPVMSTAPADQTATQGQQFTYVLAADTFTDIDAGDQLTLSATLADGQPLPTWLKFDAATGTFSGTPANGDVGDLSVKVIATDTSGATASASFNMAVSNVNDAPTVTMAAVDQAATQDQSFTYALAPSTFTDIDMGDKLTLSAKLSNGDPLPSWLKFDAATGAFSGTPANADVGNLNVVVTATDLAGASASTSFNVAVANVNDAPAISVVPADQPAVQDQSFIYTLPANTFSDVDVGDKLTFSATLADGQPLPSWLKFDAATGTFSGKPANADVGSVYVKVTATDLAGASVSTGFDIEIANVNDAPAVTVAAANQAATQDQLFSYTLAADTFTDIDGGDQLALTATLGNGQPLPSWLKFDAATGTFSGTPANGDVGSLSIKVTATDLAGASASTSFDVSVANVNDAPVVTMAAVDQAATQDQSFTYALAPNTFTDLDVGDKLTLSAKLSNGDPLPSWLKFDAATGTFSGTPANADVGSLSVKVTATDLAGATASTSFNLAVANVNDAPVVNRLIADATATAGQAMSMPLAGDTFRDVDVGDSLTLSATLANGAALPSWLTFDTAKGTLAGTPAAAGAMDILVRATDRAGASVTDSFTLTVSAAPAPAPVPGVTPPAPGGIDPARTLIGTPSNETLVGGSGNDYLRGGRGLDVLMGNGGDDTLRMSRDAWWGGGATRTNNGSPGIAGTGERVSIAGKRQSNDIFDGGSGYDTLQGSARSDAILLDDTTSPSAGNGQRIFNIERIDAGDGDDVVDLTSKRYRYGNVTIDGGDGNDVIWSSSGDDVLLGGSGNDTIRGGAGKDYLSGGSGRDDLDGGLGLDVLQGASSDDRLTDLSGNGVLDGRAGNDTITDGWGRNLIAGGTGDDRIKLGGGADVIAFNRGDGRDLVQSGQGGDATLSLGGGIRVSDLWLRRSGDALVLETGRGDQITFDGWYTGGSFQPISTLQLVTDGNGRSAITDDRVETFDFRKIVGAFDQSQAGLSRWSMSSAMAQFHLGSGSDTAALGGDLANQYASVGSLAGVGLGAAQATTGSDNFGVSAQSIANPNLKDGLVKLA